MGKCIFWRKATNRCKKFKFWNFWERPLYEISEYAFKCFNTVWTVFNCLKIIQAFRTIRESILHKFALALFKLLPNVSNSDSMYFMSALAVTKETSGVNVSSIHIDSIDVFVAYVIQFVHMTVIPLFSNIFSGQSML